MHAPQPLIGFGQVRHQRLRPAINTFAYPTHFLMLPLRSMRAHGAGSLARNRWAPLSFFDRDHGDGRPDCLAWLDELLSAEGLAAAGEVWLHTYPRVLGHTFKPVSFWYLYDAAGALSTIVVEVNNTFGERHCYLLDDSPRYGQEMRARKVFHVSPFCHIEGVYRFRFMRTAHPDHNGHGRTVARIDVDDDRGPLLTTSVSGTLEPVTAASLKRALWAYPAMTLGVVARIHWQALKLWFKRVPFVSKPPPPEEFVTR